LPVLGGQVEGGVAGRLVYRANIGATGDEQRGQIVASKSRRRVQRRQTDRTETAGSHRHYVVPTTNRDWPDRPAVARDWYTTTL
jgi:hypothetical protein